MNSQLSEFQKQTRTAYNHLLQEMEDAFHPDSFELQKSVQAYEQKLLAIQSECNHIWEECPTLGLKQCQLCGKIQSPEVQS